ncbi:2-succinyl-6-hydroxy-2, 4-cyclohexadiene-1-carboxylate synthase [Dyadobacter sp. CECT 9623]|uniref:2-succinyl-6-hydroxy-2, 4-cyclohexadiene-1-carboxylate synthase n=1 Tax=Dyadobacter linearis TaxID=2823330 RepID=A0ABM8UMN3_9BACT|nr:alpha/beta hydrolase [Dyadobacter sp. CECT 9623]CAG5068712.1 2-succinyl-6-hydroxy-2, 4-cyclohexadiene-1-carboxylate synthase [Dyadobacter sp. CECT 9623]
MSSLKFLRTPVLFIAISLSLSSCFSRYIISAKQVRKHYAQKDVKPVERIIKNDTLSLCIASIGSDTLPMLLLIHGAPGSLWGYMNLMDDEDLQKHFHIVSVDRVGYGKSRLKKRRHVTSIATQANALLPVFELNKSKEKVTVLGRSYGAPIAAKLVSLVPEQVKELVMVSPVIDPEKEKFYWFSKWGRNSFIQLFLPKQFNTATAEKYSHSDELKKLLPVWQSLQIPTTVIQGGNDWIADPANIDFAKKHIKSKRAQYIFLYNAGHMITYTHLSMIKEMLLKGLLFKEKISSLDRVSDETAITGN